MKSFLEQNESFEIVGRNVVQKFFESLNDPVRERRMDMDVNDIKFRSGIHDTVRKIFIQRDQDRPSFLASRAISGSLADGATRTALWPRAVRAF